MKILAGNWKMHKTPGEVKKFFSHLKDNKTQIPNSFRKIVAPSPCLLECTQRESEGTGVEIFSQNCHWESKGAFTGESSPEQLLSMGIKGTLVGHSERREYFGDTTESCLKRAEKALSLGLEVIFCHGEKLEDRKSGKTKEVIQNQLSQVLDLVSKNPKYQDQLILAYEPVWAIGTGLTANSEQIEDAHSFIEELCKLKLQKSLPTLYGGSVKTNNFKEICTIKSVAGGLVGGASLEPTDYLSLLRA